MIDFDSSEMDNWVNLQAVLSRNFDSSGYHRVSTLIEFDGPFVHRIGEIPYISMTQFGIKEQGSSPYIDDKRCWTPSEAAYLFRQRLWRHLIEHPAEQLAWRERPRLGRREEGDWLVYCRFALLGQPAEDDI